MSRLMLKLLTVIFSKNIYTLSMMPGPYNKRLCIQICIKKEDGSLSTVLLFLKKNYLFLGLKIVSEPLPSMYKQIL